jgi:hypothetical protein
MATRVNTINQAEQFSGQPNRLTNTGRQMLDVFVSSWMRFVASAAKRGRPQQSEEPHPNGADVRPGLSAATFEPLDPNVVNCSISAFFIGRNADGLWVAREAKGRIGGVFMLKRSAVSFAHEQAGAAGCATIFPSEQIELDLENEGNRLASYLAPLLRLFADRSEMDSSSR